MNGNEPATAAAVAAVDRRVELLGGKLDAYIAAHTASHTNDREATINARADPGATRTGQILTKDIEDLARISRTHERVLQRLTGAVALASALGLGAIILVGLRIAGLLG